MSAHWMLPGRSLNRPWPLARLLPGLCGDEDDACAILAGSKMFSLTINAVREYLDGAGTQQD
jgi:hypothetical protein